MSKSNMPDNIFKQGLGEMKFAGRDALWQKMEGQLDLLEEKKKKRRMFFLLLLTALVMFTGGFFTAKHFIYKDSNAYVQVNQPPASLPGAAEKQPVTTVADYNNAAGDKKTGPPSIPVSSANALSVSLPQKSISVNENSTHVEVSPEETVGPAAVDDESVLNRESVFIETAANPFMPYDNAVKIKPIAATIASMPVAKNKVEKRVKKFSLDAVAGSDIFKLNRKVGYYAGIRVTKTIDKGTAISAGINYSNNSLNEKYRLSSKPQQQPEADAQVNGIKMIRMPVYFHRDISNTKFSVMAGLMPSYIIDASVYNIPSSGGNPSQYRRFTISDMNRFNILFGAGVKYSLGKNIGVELSGSYGLTGLVKNSYINQSRVNDNFKNIQAGVVYRLR